jgi:hypothetical protein
MTRWKRGFADFLAASCALRAPGQLIVKATRIRAVSIANLGLGFAYSVMVNKNSEALEALRMENSREGLISLRSKHSRKLSWKDTAAEMARENDSWNVFETTVGDGLDQHRANF